jgi:hypothetical protein
LQSHWANAQCTPEDKLPFKLQFVGHRKRH